MSTRRLNLKHQTFEIPVNMQVLRFKALNITPVTSAGFEVTTNFHK